ncbi:hypothetical protein A3K88_15510 [Pseudomonas putida]|nr:hypothetical protein G1E_32590 [Pseudomonas sp. TJI-51]OAK61747.1 hypothetical protein A3K88_15510 [Pseudomonas putida]
MVVQAGLHTYCVVYIDTEHRGRGLALGAPLSCIKLGNTILPSVKTCSKLIIRSEIMRIHSEFFMLRKRSHQDVFTAL